MDSVTCEGDAFPYHYKYPRPAVTTDCVIFGYDGGALRVLLVRRGRDPYKGRWAFPGGFLEMDESADRGVVRELREETGLDVTAVRQFHTFSDPSRDPRGRVISIGYYAVIALRGVRGGDDAADARWFALDAVPPLAFDHDMMLALALTALRDTLRLDPTGRSLGLQPYVARRLADAVERAVPSDHASDSSAWL